MGTLAGTVFNLGTTVVTWTVDDEHGNTSNLHRGCHC